MTELEEFKLLGIALAIGLLIGLERGWRLRERGEGMRVAGLRTYGLIGLLGGISAMLAQQAGPLLMGFIFIALAFVLLLAYNRSFQKNEDIGITSIVASLITFALGALTVYGYDVLASATAVIMTLLLGFKPLLHRWVYKLERKELEATLKLLLISVVMLPILPNRNYGPWGGFNPYYTWLMVVLIAGISYLGYFAIRILGERHGPVVTGLFGGLVSSTAVSINLSGFSISYQNRANALSAGILTACGTMFLRTLLLVWIFNHVLLRVLLPSMIIMSFLSYLAALILWYFSKDFRSDESIRLENPFQLGTALKFGAFLSLIIMLSKFLEDYFGNVGTYALAAISGLADVDPITLTMSKMSNEGLDTGVAARAILIAVSVNSGVKSLITFFVGGLGMGLRVGGALTVAIAVGLVIA